MATNRVKFVLISAPSGSGKSTIIKKLLNEYHLPLEFSISATSRAIRKGEQHGRDYYFLSPAEFKTKIEQDFFLEWEEVYPGRYYGTPKTEIDRIGNNEKHILFELDAVGGVKLKNCFPDNTLAIFIVPPSIEELKNRLKKRGSDSQQEITTRVSKAEKELSKKNYFDHTVVNQDIEKSTKEVASLISNFLEE